MSVKQEKILGINGKNGLSIDLWKNLLNYVWKKQFYHIQVASTWISHHPSEGPSVFRLWANKASHPASTRTQPLAWPRYNVCAGKSTKRWQTDWTSNAEIEWDETSWRWRERGLSWRKYCLAFTQTMEIRMIKSEIIGLPEEAFDDYADGEIKR